MVTRRSLLKAGVVAGVSGFFPWRFGVQDAHAFSQSANLAKFIQPIRGLGANGIPVAVSDGLGSKGGVHYSIGIVQFEDQLHPSLPNPTRLWGYRPSNVTSAKHLGGVIVAARGTPVQITATNQLPPNHIIPVDTTISGDEPSQPQNRATIHLHGGLVPWISDGGPFSWFDPNGHYGPSVQSQAGNIYAIMNPAIQRGQAEYYYPNNQGARVLWYHDHAVGLTRINAYAGIASAYVITDDYEALTMTAGYNVPGPLDPRTKYLIFQDKVFVDSDDAMEIKDPTWQTIMPNSRAGDLWYAHSYEPARWTLAPGGSPPNPSVIAEFFGDTILVNGTVSPFLEVEQRQYRFRLLNACNARFLSPRLVYARGASGTEPNPNAAGPAFIQIGNEAGFLPAPAMLNGPQQPTLLVAPAERADIIVDFRNVPAGSILILYNDAPAPFPKGDARNDYYPENPKTPSSLPGFSPNTRTLLQIRVKQSVGAADPIVRLPATNMQNPNDGPFLVSQQPGVPTQPPAGVLVRRLTLNETFDAFGRLIQMLGTDQQPDPGSTKRATFGRPYESAQTEVVTAGSVEVWEILNLTGDTHPIHFHLVNVQVLSRQAFSAKTYSGGAPNYLGPLMAPDLNELGWKETVRMNPGEVTRVIMKFGLSGVPFAVPPSPRTGGNEYVWHCHILEHEEHDMMRPLIVT
ncbi:multicopper oxidase family protein [Burkholderia ubonensis]|uniref:multicopper oxidase family protein n=1 Tax=Burkholderia ubonensis TaxID=101571 RepID=UPI0007C68181|nr:multicopper oxidase domain-containing protein [Burkholderia ubonensis]